MNELKLFDYFVGSWKINRILGNLGVAEGSALFEPYSTRQLNYSECLKTEYKDFESIQQAARNYIYIYHEQDKIITKNYEDRSLLYNLDFSPCGNCASGTHLCGNDLYNAYYTFIDSDNFTLKYLVKGPYKDFTIRSRFIKMKGG